MLRKRVFAAFAYGAILNFASPDGRFLAKDIRATMELIQKRKKAETDWKEAAEKAREEGRIVFLLLRIIEIDSFGFFALSVVFLNYAFWWGKTGP